MVRLRHDRPSPFPIVGVGASAGGLQAFERLLRHLPMDTGMAFLLVQHLDPKHESRLAELLARATSMPVAEVRDGMRVRPNRVYVIPPDSDMHLRAGTLRLQPRKDAAAQHRPIDVLFRSLANVQKNKAVGIILSGAASDGTAGVKAIKGEGGITFAQDPGSAEYFGMPQSAIATGEVDFVLPPEEIAMRLARLGGHPYVSLEAADPGDPALRRGRGEPIERLFQLLEKSFGVDFSAYKPATINRRIRRRMALHGIHKLEEYLRYVTDKPDELQDLYRDMFIGVTSFFREPETFEALKRLVFPRIARKVEGPIRVWVPGCSTGEEVYSLAIALVEYLKHRAGTVPIQIFGTDINEEAIRKARRRRYQDDIAADVGRGRLLRFFRKTDDGYEVSKLIRDLVGFAKHDVARDPPFSRLDLISCRNVLIYLDTPLQRRLVPLFHYALKPAGFLLLGTAETIGGFSDAFALVDRQHKIYSRAPGLVRPSFDFAASPPVPLRPAEAAPAPQPRRGDLDLQKEAADLVILNEYAPAAVLVNEEQEILSFRGHTGPYLEPAPGTASLNLLKMVRQGLLVGLRAAFRAARKKNTPARADGLRVESDGRERVVNLHVVPVRAPGSRQRTFLVLFEDVARRVSEEPLPAGEPARGHRAAAAREQRQRVVQLKLELSATKAYLQSVIESHEASNEELRSLNEELLSTNEEFQSTTEELETANEELQSANEELNTLNEELQHGNAELAEAQSDILNLLSSMELSVIMLDRELRIRRLTPTAQKEWHLRPGDVGRPLTETRLAAEIPVLEQLILDAMAATGPQALEVQDSRGRWRALKVHPYVIDGKSAGAVVALPDIHDLKLAEAKFRALVESAPDATVIVDADGRIDLVNAQAEKMFGCRSDELIGQAVETLVPPRLRERHLEHRLRYVREPRSRRMGRIELVAWRRDGGEFPVEISLSPIETTQGLLVSTTLRDISERRQLEAQARRAAVLEERGRIAREVHDTLTQGLTAIALQLDGVEDVLGTDAEQARRHVVRARDLARQNLDEARRALHALRPQLLDQADLPDALRRMASGLAAGTSRELEVSVQGEQRPLPADVEDGLLRIAQEALTNAVKHTEASHVRAELRFTRGAVRLEIADQGPGFDPRAADSGPGLGLAIMKERAERLGGTLRVKSEPGKGTRVVARVSAPAVDRDGRS